MRNPYLEVNKDIRLHFPSPEYALELFRLIDSQRKYLREWMPWTDSVQSESYMSKVLKEDIRYNIGGQKLTTYILVNGKIAGSVSLVKIDKEHQKGEIGYWLSQNFQGKGIMTACVKRLIFYAFSTMNINKLSMSITSENQASLKIPKKLNFKHEGILRQDAFIKDKFYDVEIFGLLKEEFGM